MEALGAGANAAAFVVIAAQLSKLLYTTFNSIKDGPDDVRKIANHMLQLHRVLEQLKLSPLAAHDDALTRHIALCVKDLNLLANEITKLQFLPGEQRTGRMWKRFKCFVDERKLDNIRDQLVQHISTLNFRHSVLQSNAIYKTLSNAYLATKSIEALNAKITQQIQGQASGLDNLGQSMQSLLTSQTDTLQSNLSSIQAGIESFSSISHSNTNIMLNVLDEIKNLVTSHSSWEGNQKGKEIYHMQDDHSSSSKEVGEAENLREELGRNNDLIRTITRLCDLIKLKNRTLDTHSENDLEAEDIIEDLQNLLKVARRNENTADTALETSPVALRSDIRRFNQAFGQFGLTVNAEDPRRNERFPRTAMTRVQTCAKLQIGDLGSLSLRIIKWTEASPEPAEGTQKDDACCYERRMVATFMPSDPKKFDMIVATTLQRGLLGSIIPSISRLDVNRVLPIGSPVFMAVQEGRLEELRMMLQNGEASLRDHDEEGANLLMYAVYNPAICRFLLSTNSFDLDHVGRNGGVSFRGNRTRWIARHEDIRNPEERSREISVLEFESYERLFSGTDLTNGMECRKLLIEAGADPTIQVRGRTFIERIVIYGGSDSIKFFLGPRLRSHLAYLNDTLLDINTLLFSACWIIDIDRFQERISSLLELGADISIRDSRGRSCLHVFLSHTTPFSMLPKQLNGVVYLLDNGADPYAFDNEGVSVSDVAYENRTFFFLKKDTGSMLGDLWDTALHHCGYDIAEFRQRHQRKANYSSYYTRKIFETFWEGKEDKCPYWDDVTWPQPKIWPLPEFEYSDDEVDGEAGEENAGECEGSGDGGAVCPPKTSTKLNAKSPLRKAKGKGILRITGGFFHRQSVLAD
ncbi:ankyrin [Xylaria digitata]|nr:ankyrin [Xylaria digitata]